MLTESASSKINETIFSDRDFSEFIILSIIQFKTIAAFDLLRLKNKKLIKAEKLIIEAILDRKN